MINEKIKIAMIVILVIITLVISFIALPTYFDTLSIQLKILLILLDISSLIGIWYIAKFQL